jgi:regulator of replication initiation timing
MADDKTFTKDELDAAVAKAVEAATGDVDGLKAKVEEVIGENKKLKADLRKTQDIKPEDVAALEHEVDDLKAKLADATKAATDAAKAKEKAEKALEAETGFTQKLLIQDGLKSELLKNGVKDEDFIDSLTAKFATGASIAAEGDQRKAMYGDKPLADFIKEWAGSDAGKKFVAAPTNSGGGAEGGGRAKVDAKTMSRSSYDALEQQAKAELGPQLAKGELRIVDEAA